MAEFNIKTLNKLFIDWIVTDERCILSKEDGNNKILVTNGIVGYFLSENEILINRQSVNEKGYGVFDDFEFKKPLLDTMILEQHGGKTLRKFITQYDDKDKDFEVYVNDKLLKHFKDCYFWSMGPKKQVLVTRVIDADSFDDVVGIVMPINKK